MDNNNINNNNINNNPDDVLQTILGEGYDENNDYQNNNYTDQYSNQYNGQSYLPPKEKNGLWWKILIVIILIVIIILLLLKFCGAGKSSDEKYTELTNRICKAAQKYIEDTPNMKSAALPGKSLVIKLKTLADANLIDAKIENPNYNGGLFKKGTEDKYYSMDGSVRVSILGDGSYNCELVDNSKDITSPELRLNGDREIILAVGTDFEDPGFSATDDYDGDISDKAVRSGNVDNSQAGEYELTYTAQDSAGNATTEKRKIIYEDYKDIEVTMGSINDNVAPIIKLRGANPYCMVKGTHYEEPGATATDNVDGNITDRIAVTSKVTGNILGTFRVTYTVEDSSGNKATVYRAVTVATKCQDTVKEPKKAVNSAPTVTLVGKNSVTINKGTEYIDLGATAYDKEDGDLTSRITVDDTQVNTRVAGIYKVIYRVTDSNGSTSTKTRTVTVKDKVTGTPVVRFTENKSNITVIVGEGKNDLLAAPKAVNENGKNITVNMAIENYTTKETVKAIDWNKAGKYRVIYTAVHGDGVLKQTKTVVVTILDDEVTIGGKDTIEVNKRTENCNITEEDLINGGVVFTTAGDTAAVVALSNNEGKACTPAMHSIDVLASTGTGPIVKKTIYVSVVEHSTQQTEENSNLTPVNSKAPSKVMITSNSINSTDAYNTNSKWAGGAITGITVKFKIEPVKGAEISHYEYSKSCDSMDGKVSKQSESTGELTWTEEGKYDVCIRAVTTNDEKGPWSNPVRLYLDKTGPKVEFTHTWKDGVHDWYSENSLTLTYKATDTGSGLDHFEYTYDDVKAKKASDITTYEEANGTLTVKEDTEASRGQLYVYVRAVDKAGNKGEWTLKPAYANMDTVKPNAPEITKVTGDKTSEVVMSLKAKDGSSVRPSGIGKFVYTLNDGNELSTNVKENSNGCDVDTNSNKDSNTYTEVENLCIRKSDYNGEIVLPTNTTTSDVEYKVKVWSVDRAGNRSEGYASKDAIVTPSKNPATGVEISYAGIRATNGNTCMPVSTEIFPQKTYQLTAKSIPIDADNKEVTWSSSDTSIATVDSTGKITTKADGTATIIANIGNINTICTITVDKQFITCAEGEYLPKGKNQCERCLAGSECSGGSYPISDAADQGMKMCPVGTYNDNEGAVSCIQCPKGKYNDRIGSKACTDCPTGSYSINEGSTSCTSDAPSVPTCIYSFDSYDAAETYGAIYCANKYGNEKVVKAFEKPDACGKFGFDCETKSGSGDTITCEAGYYHRAGETGCTAKCPAGSRCPGGVFTATTEKYGIEACAVGYYQDETGKSNCKQCTDNKTTSSTGSTKESDCKAPSTNSTQVTCNAGYYHPTSSTNEGVIKCTTSCPVGYYCEGGTFDKSQYTFGIDKCPDGYTSSPNSKSIYDCYITVYDNKYVKNVGEDQQDCPPGTTSKHHSLRYGKTSTCEEENIEIITCDAGYYLNANNECKICPVGTYSDKEGAIKCEPCASGYYGSNTGLTECTRCPENQTSPRGSTSISQCEKSSNFYKCDAGYYHKDGDAENTCETDCPSGYYCPGGSYDKKSNSYGIIQCPIGYSNSKSNATKETDCYYSVPAGYAILSKGSDKTQCDVGQYKGGHRVFYGKTSNCEDCPPGYTSKAGSTKIEECKAENEVVCYAGYYHKSGTDPNSCNDKCPENHYCPGGSFNKGNGDVGISECPPGTISEAGSKVETQCKNEKTTIKCEKGYYHEAGTNPNLCNAKCSINYYCPGGLFDKKSDVYGRYACPTGYASKEGSTKKSDCEGSSTVTCPEGYYHPAGTSESICHTICQENHYCPGGKFDKSSNEYGIFRCSAGSKSKEGSTAESDCKVINSGVYNTSSTCEPGYYHYKDVNGINCGCNVKCPQGAYCPGGMSGDCKSTYGIIQCSPGKTTDKMSSTSEDDCKTKKIICEAGYYHPNSSSTACSVKCPQGLYCPGGTFDFTTSVVGLEKCPEGKTTYITGARSKDNCEDVGAKNTAKNCDLYENTRIVNGKPVYCPDGYISKYERISCDLKSYDKCTACPQGTYQSNDGTYRNCTACSEGEYQNIAGMTSCKKCNPGYFSGVGASECYKLETPNEDKKNPVATGYCMYRKASAKMATNSSTSANRSIHQTECKLVNNSTAQCVDPPVPIDDWILYYSTCKVTYK